MEAAATNDSAMIHVLIAIAVPADARPAANMAGVHRQRATHLADPLASILTMVDDKQLQVAAMISLRPVPNLWQRWLRHRLPDDDRQKAARSLYRARLTIRVAAAAGKKTLARRKRRGVAAAYGQFAGNEASVRRTFWPRGFYVSTEELATLWHLPTMQVRTAKLATVQSRELEPPAVFPSVKGSAILGRVSFRERRQTFGIQPDDRLRHLGIVGKTGMGKSTLLESLIRSDIEAGRGVVLIDPHGNLATSVLDHIPRRRTNETIVFDVGDHCLRGRYRLCL